MSEAKLSPLYDSQQWVWYRSEKEAVYGLIDNRLLVRGESGGKKYEYTVPVEVPSELNRLLIVLYRSSGLVNVKAVKLSLVVEEKECRLYAVSTLKGKRTHKLYLWRYPINQFPAWALKCTK